MKYARAVVVACAMLVAAALTPQAFAQSEPNAAAFAYDAMVAQSKARADFYQGVQLLNSGNIAEAVVAFQRALTLDPQNGLVRYYLARSYGAYGQVEFFDTVMRELVQSRFYPTYISAKLELSQLMRTADTGTMLQYGVRNAVRAASIDLLARDYKSPMSLRVLPSGLMLLTSLGSNTVSLLTPTGETSKELLKTAALLSRPTDSAYLADGSLLVTEFVTDRIDKFSPDGSYLGPFMQGDPPPRFKGPQYITVDAYGGVFVSAFGNARIIKFDDAGAFVMEFGGPAEGFSGLQQPTGLAVANDALWVIDNQNDGMYFVVFDLNGNFIERHFIADDRGESVRAYGSKLLIAAHKQVLIFDTASNTLVDSFALSDFSKLTSAVFDVNDMLWIVDQQRGRIEAFSRPTGQYTGISTTILSLRTEQFPKVTARVYVTSVSKAPVVGLNRANFAVFEDDVPAKDVQVVDDSQTVQNTNVVIVPLASAQPLHKTRIMEVVRQLAGEGGSAVPGLPIFWVMRAGSDVGYQLRESAVGNQILNAVENALKDVSNQDAEQTAAQQIQNFRIALNTLLPVAGKKTLVFIGEAPRAAAMENPQWRQLFDIARANAISLVWAHVPESEPQIAVLGGDGAATRESRAVLFASMLNAADASVVSKVQNVFEYSALSEGAGLSLSERIVRPQAGVYTISFTSRYTLPAGQYPERYISVSVESYYFTRSGKDLGGFILSSVR